MKLWLAVLTAYAIVWAIYGIARWAKRRRTRTTPGPWRVIGKGDLMYPPTTKWYAENWFGREAHGPFATSAEAQAECNRRNRRLQKLALHGIRYGGRSS